MKRKKSLRPVPSVVLERDLSNQGYQAIVGLDEVGRGAWAGPLVMGAVLFRSPTPVRGLRDSKLLAPAVRERLAAKIAVLTRCGIGLVLTAELNQLGLTKGLELAAQRAVAQLGILPDHCIFDGNVPLKGLAIPQTVVVRGDETVRCVAAASVVAKVFRDQWMRELHAQRSDLRPYNFDRNKGYPSRLHMEQLQTLGISSEHRTFFGPIAQLISRAM